MNDLLQLLTYTGYYNININERRYIAIMVDLVYERILEFNLI